MQLPDKYTVKSARNNSTRMSLVHRHVTTTDFFRVAPVVCREVVPNDRFNIDITSFVRFFPMPVPTFGRVRYYNRVFFVPFRQIMEGWNEFMSDTTYYDNQNAVKINSAPWFTNADLASAFIYDDGSDLGMLSAPVGTDTYYWRRGTNSQGKEVDYLVDYTGKSVAYTRQGDTHQLTIDRDVDDGELHFSVTYNPYGTSVHGTFVQEVSDDVITYTITDTTQDATYKLEGPYPSYMHVVTMVAGYELPVSSTDYDKVKYDFMLGDVPMRFSNVGRHFYSLLCSLGYRVDFTSNSDGEFTQNKRVAAGKLLAWAKVFLDWYSPSAYYDSNIRNYFRGVASSGRRFYGSDIYRIAIELQYGTYDRDYFTSAWQNPSSPNTELSHVDILDTTIHNDRSQAHQIFRSGVTNYSDPGQNAHAWGSDNGTPSINGRETFQDGSTTKSAMPGNISQFILDSLRALTNYVRRFQLSGNRAVDRHLAQYGVRLTDDQSDRCYYIGGYSYDADVSDIMSNADTEFAPLGDYAGKGIAYSDARRNFNFTADGEAGYLFVIASVVPNAGYVQGMMRENLHLNRFDFYQGDFDNLGTQAIRKDELFGDAGLLSIDGSGIAETDAPDGVFGFSPRYMEYKIGYDYLTGDFNVPSRREGLDAYHLFRLFKDGHIPSVNKDFLIGEQSQYDRIFQNTDDDYDHMYVIHRVVMNADRPMKSATDVYDFEGAPGRDIEVNANGTQLN